MSEEGLVPAAAWPSQGPTPANWAAPGDPAGVSGVLILRAWHEGPAAAGLRIRILARPDVSKSAEDSMTTGLIDEATDFVRSWLTRFGGGPAAGSGTVTGQ